MGLDVKDKDELSLILESIYIYALHVWWLFALHICLRGFLQQLWFPHPVQSHVYVHVICKLFCVSLFFFVSVQKKLSSFFFLLLG